MSKGENANLRMKRVCELLKENREHDYENIKYVTHDKEKPSIALYAFVQKQLFSMYKYEDIVAEIKKLPPQIKALSHAIYYLRKVLMSKLSKGEIHHKDAVKVNISDMIKNTLGKK